MFVSHSSQPRAPLPPAPKRLQITWVIIEIVISHSISLYLSGWYIIGLHNYLLDELVDD